MDYYMMDKDILKKQIRQLAIRSHKLVNEIFAGQYQSVFKGQGIEFAEVREYQIGDDFRSIDHNVTARFGKPYIKLFSEERELTVIFLIDVSSSQRFGSTDRLKSEITAEVAALLAFASLKNNDSVGMLSFTDKVEKVIAPRKGRNNILKMIYEILDSNFSGTETSISVALKAINGIWRRKAIVFLISDFQDENYEKDLAMVAKRHDLICIKIEDNRESDLPAVGLVEMEDLETKETMTIDTSAVYESFKQKNEDFKKETVRIFKKAAVSVINLNTGGSYVNPLIRFFKERERRIRRECSHFRIPLIFMAIFSFFDMVSKNA
ncbi:hypothetical protein AGMMS49532_05170 [Endomicrobiia bacterium]|nr:hypothetical protein AGMMS49532_05170 [Endomicrobiia bacterium]GHT23014.1 hypothetical protein AGMMS49953_02850 [Endomicrobiia bacterium]